MINDRQFDQNTVTSKLTSDLGNHQNFKGKNISTILNFLEGQEMLPIFQKACFSAHQQTLGCLFLLETTYHLLKTLPYNN